MAVSYALVGGCFLSLVTASTLTVAVLATAASGLPGAVALAATAQRLQTATPDGLRGRVVAAFRTSDAFAAIAGALAAPALVTAAGLEPALVAFAAVVPVAGLLTAVLLRAGTRPRESRLSKQSASGPPRFAGTVTGSLCERPRCCCHRDR